MTDIIAFPTHRLGHVRDSQVAIVTDACPKGQAIRVKPLHNQHEIVVHSQHKRTMGVRKGDWVRVSYGEMGAVIEARVAKPGKPPMPKLEHDGEQLHVDMNDPAWRFYREVTLKFGETEVTRLPNGKLRVRHYSPDAKVCFNGRPLAKLIAAKNE